MKALLCFAMAAVAALSVGCSHTPQQRADRAYYKALNLDISSGLGAPISEAELRIDHI